MEETNLTIQGCIDRVVEVLNERTNGLWSYLKRNTDFKHWTITGTRKDKTEYLVAEVICFKTNEYVLITYDYQRNETQQIKLTMKRLVYELVYVFGVSGFEK